MPRSGRIVGAAAYDLWNVVRLELRIAGINALGRKRQQEILVEF